jgi:hypothetical protein
MQTASQIVASVGYRVGDTSAAFAAQILKYVNYRYKEIWERFNWGTIKIDYTFQTVPGTQDYKLEAGFWKPLYCYDSTNMRDIYEVSLQDLERVNAVNLSDQGQPIKYALYEKMNASTPTPTGEIERWVRLYPTPSSIFTLAMPYQVEPLDMALTDKPILECDYEVEIGATAEAWRTKRQFAKAADFDQQYEAHIQHMIWRRENSPGRIVQFAPKTYDKEQLY